MTTSATSPAEQVASRPGTFRGPDLDELSQADPEIADVVLGELARSCGGLQLIASENLVAGLVAAFPAYRR
jgi:glycine hydroxymethyltransferase